MTQESIQKEMPFAMVRGEIVTELPKDLYIPPEAMEVFLDTFEGPLDLLLYLIRKQNLDILDIPVAEITRQYMGYIDLMQMMNLDLASEYMVMAAMLAEIKSRMLLPRLEPEAEDEEDPRALLVCRLQEYERYRQAALDIEKLPRVGRDIYLSNPVRDHIKMKRNDPHVEIHDLLMAFSQVMKRVDEMKSFNINREILSIRERMSIVLDQVNNRDFIAFESLFEKEEGKMGMVVTFMAILELLKENLILIIQNEQFASIHVKAVA
ncbi:MAG: segregation/condensation protein A [Gammaproteobacteria bacterium]|nr:segregation/condensation protein A [Gammaproteobacteria bacterium]